MSYKGFLDKIENGIVYGWAFNSKNPSEKVKVLLLIDKYKVAETTANLYREDLKNAGIGDGFHGFEFKIPESYLDGKTHKVSVLVAKTGENLKNSPIKIILKKEKKYKGHVDKIENYIVKGWVFNELNPNELVKVQLQIDDQSIQNNIADKYRPDLKEVGIGDGWHGLWAFIPTIFADNKEHILSIKPANIKFKFKLKKIRYNEDVIKFSLDKLLSAISIQDVIANSDKYGIFISKFDILDFLNGKKFIPIKIFKESHLNSLLYYEIGKLFAIARDVPKAEAYYTLSLIEHTIYENNKRELLANLYLENNLAEIALFAYKSINPDKSTFWATLNLSLLLQQKDRIKEALKSLDKGLQIYYGNILLKKKLQEFLKIAWDKLLQELRTKVYSHINKKQILNWLWGETKYIYDLLRQSLNLNNTINKPLNINKVLIIAGSLDLPQCKRYRIDQKVEQLKSAGIDVEVIPYTEIDKHFDKILDYDVFVFYRHPPTFDILKFLAYVNALGKVSIFEIDDLVFDVENYPPPIENFAGAVDAHLYNNLEYGMYLFNVMARLCKYGIVSTNILAKRLKPLVKTGKVFIHRNALDSKNIFIEPKTKKKDKITIFYGSGTLSHNKDFIDLALPALDKILEEFENVELVVSEFVKLPEDFLNRHKDKIRIFPFYKDIGKYYLELAKADINLAVLYDGIFEGAKSELKWFEAACVGVPSVLSSTANYRDIIRHGEDGFLAKDWKDFYKYLKLLIKNEDLRLKIAKTAQERVKREYSVEVMGKNLRNILETIKFLEEKPFLTVKTKKKKIGLVNVFYPPELIGGGTVIAYENVKVLQRDFSDKYDVSIFTSEAHYMEDVKPYTLEQYVWEGIPVYKVHPAFKKEDGSFKENFEWEYYDEKMKEVFKKYIESEKPDVVHFHAIQRLTASVVEACLEYGIPYVITAHDAWWISDWMFLTDSEGNVYPDGFPELISDRPLPKGVTLYDSIKRRQFLKELAEKAFFFYTVSEEFAKLYKAHGISNVEVIENGISEFIEWKEKDTSYTPRVVLGFTSAFAVHKGYDIFHQALEMVEGKNLEVVLVDYSKPENYLSFGFIGKVPTRILGAFDRMRINRFYSQIDVLVHPSKWPESYGLSPREALASGCYTVISTRTGALKDFKDKEGAIIIEPTFEEMLKVIKEIDKNPEKFKKRLRPPKLRTISEQVRELVERVYSKT